MMTQQSDAPPVSAPTQTSTSTRTNRPPHTHWLLLGIVIVMLGGFMWYFGVFRSRPDIAIVAGESAYWDLIIKGAQEAADRYDADLVVVRAQPDLESQNAKIREVTARKLDGIAVSPINPAAEAALLFEIASKTPLVTMDSDAPISKRLCFVGTDNYAAGRIVGQHVRLALGETGGEVVIAMSNLEKDNAIHRRQGVIDELLDRPFVPEQAMDPVDQVHKGQTFTIVATLLDNGDRERATQLATEALKSNPNVKCVIGLNAHNAPALVKSLQQAGKLGQIKIVGFDADPQTLDAIEAGHVHATIMQDQFGCGFQTVRILAENARGDTSGLPMFQRRTLPVEPVTAANVAAARAKLQGKPAPTTNASLPSASDTRSARL